MLALIVKHLLSLSPSYRASRIALRREINRRIGYARHLARKAMTKAAMVEQQDWRELTWCDLAASSAHASREDNARWFRHSPFRYTGPGFLPANVWRALPLFGRTFRSL